MIRLIWDGIKAAKRITIARRHVGFSCEKQTPLFNSIISQNITLSNAQLAQKQKDISNEIKKPALMNQDSALTPIRNQVHSIIFEILNEKKSQTQTITNYIFQNLGKMYRPMLFYLLAKAIQESKGNQLCGEMERKVLYFCACIEIAHNVSLLQDDIIDQSTTRRGKRTSHTIYGIVPTVFASSYILSKACKYLAHPNNEVISQTYSQIVHLLVKVLSL
jgi:geranylgeranyl pyrophosphate synthase